MANILVTGSTGQVGSELQLLAKDLPHTFVFSKRGDFDISDESSIDQFVTGYDIKIIINCAAYTAVDQAETERDLAVEVNVTFVKHLATIAKKRALKLIHLSTDYVFNGRSDRPYIETDSTCPNSCYGETKRDGENALLEINPPHSCIIRTSWVYSSFGSNFVKTMLRLGNERDELKVVNDQVGSPTYAGDIAKVIIAMMAQLENEELEIYHFSNTGVTSWYEFAKTIMAKAKLKCMVRPIPSTDYPTPAERPAYSVLNTSKIAKLLQLTIADWKDSLDECLERLEVHHNA